MYIDESSRDFDKEGTSLPENDLDSDLSCIWSRKHAKSDRNRQVINFQKIGIEKQNGAKTERNAKKKYQNTYLAESIDEDDYKTREMYT